jgi:hypothetical protein
VNAHRASHITVALDAMFRRLARGNQHRMMLSRDATIAGPAE